MEDKVSWAEAGVRLQAAVPCVMYEVVRPNSIGVTSASVRSPTLENLVGNP